MYVTVEGGGGEKNHYLLNIYLDLDKYKKNNKIYSGKADIQFKKAHYCKLHGTKQNHSKRHQPATTHSK